MSFQLPLASASGDFYAPQLSSASTRLIKSCNYYQIGDDRRIIHIHHSEFFAINLLLDAEKSIQFVSFFSLLSDKTSASGAFRLSY